MKLEFTEDDVRGMCIYLKGDQKTISYECRFVRDPENLLNKPFYSYGSFLLECGPGIIEEFIQKFASTDPNGHFIMKLCDPIRDPFSLECYGKIRYQCVSMLLPNRDIFLMEILKQSNTLVTIGNYANDSHHFTLFIPVVEKIPSLGISSFLLNEHENIVGLSIIYDRYYGL